MVSGYAVPGGRCRDGPGAGLVALPTTPARRCGLRERHRDDPDLPGYAVQTEELVPHRGRRASTAAPRAGHGRVTADPIGADGVFVGWRARPTSAATSPAWHTTLSDPFDAEGADTAYADGEASRIAPEDADIWATSASGTGSRTVTWGARTRVLDAGRHEPGDATAPVATDEPGRRAPRAPHRRRRAARHRASWSAVWQAWVSGSSCRRERHPVLRVRDVGMTAPVVTVAPEEDLATRDPADGRARRHRAPGRRRARARARHGDRDRGRGDAVPATRGCASCTLRRRTAPACVRDVMSFHPVAVLRTSSCPSPRTCWSTAP